MDKVSASPPGVVAVYEYEGRVIAHAADFERSTPGGCTLLEGQTWRAKRRLAFEILKALASPVLYENLDEYDCERIMGKMKGAYRILPIGHSDCASDNGSNT